MDLSTLNFYDIVLKILWTLLAIALAYIFSKIAKRILAFITKRLPGVVKGLLSDLLSIGIYIIALYAILSIWNLEEVITPILAGAGIVGLAVGFASKDVVANFISGIFILVDKPFKVGDKIEVKGIKGRVLKIGLRVTKLETEEGEIATVPNSILASNIVKKFREQK